MLSIQGKLPNVVAAGPDLRALRLLLNLQLAEAALLRPDFGKYLSGCDEVASSGPVN